MESDHSHSGPTFKHQRQVLVIFLLLVHSDSLPHRYMSLDTCRKICKGQRLRKLDWRSRFVKWFRPIHQLLLLYYNDRYNYRLWGASTSICRSHHLHDSINCWSSWLRLAFWSFGKSTYRARCKKSRSARTYADSGGNETRVDDAKLIVQGNQAQHHLQVSGDFTKSKYQWLYLWTSSQFTMLGLTRDSQGPIIELSTFLKWNVLFIILWLAWSSFVARELLCGCRYLQRRRCHSWNFLHGKGLSRLLSASFQVIFCDGWAWRHVWSCGLQAKCLWSSRIRFWEPRWWL